MVRSHNNTKPFGQCSSFIARAGRSYLKISPSASNESGSLLRMHGLVLDDQSYFERKQRTPNSKKDRKKHRKCKRSTSRLQPNLHTLEHWPFPARGPLVRNCGQNHGRSSPANNFASANKVHLGRASSAGCIVYLEEFKER